MVDDSNLLGDERQRLERNVVDDKVDLGALEFETRARNLLDKSDSSGKDDIDKVSVQTRRLGLEGLRRRYRPTPSVNNDKSDEQKRGTNVDAVLASDGELVGEDLDLNGEVVSDIVVGESGAVRLKGLDKLVDVLLVGFVLNEEFL